MIKCNLPLKAVSFSLSAIFHRKVILVKSASEVWLVKFTVLFSLEVKCLRNSWVNRNVCVSVCC